MQVFRGLEFYGLVGVGEVDCLVARGGMNFVIFPGAISEENYWKMGNCACWNRVEFLIKKKISYKMKCKI